MAKASRRGDPRWMPLQILPLVGLGEIQKGDDLESLCVAAAAKSGLEFASGDILAVAQKIISKAEGRVISLSSIHPSTRAQDLAAKRNRDPRLVELIIRESRRVVR